MTTDEPIRHLQTREVLLDNLANLRKGPRPDLDLSSADLRGWFLEGLDLSGVCLRGADLSGARVRDVNLSGSNLRGASLIGAGLYGVRLDQADLARADLCKANLAMCEVINCEFCDADLRKAGLRNTNLVGSDFRGADLRGADLFGADLLGVNLQGANLTRTRHRVRAPEGYLDTRVAPPADGTRRRRQDRMQANDASSVAPVLPGGGDLEGYSPAEIAEYGAHLRHVEYLLSLPRNLER